MYIGNQKNLMRKLNDQIEYLEKPKYIVLKDNNFNYYIITKIDKKYLLLKGINLELYFASNKKEEIIKTLQEIGIYMLYEKQMDKRELKIYLFNEFKINIESVLDYE